MRLYVYPLRRKGGRLPRTSIGRIAFFAREGILRFYKAPFSHFRKEIWQAQILNEAGKDMLPMLEHARLLRISKGLLIAGHERHHALSKDTGTLHRQSWFCANERLPRDCFARYEADEDIRF